MVDSSERFVVMTEGRPVRIAVLLPGHPSRQAYRRAIRELSAVNAGPHGGIFTLGIDGQVDARWMTLLRVIDPDALFVPPVLRSHGRQRRLRDQLDRAGVAPRWVAPLTERLSFEPGWVPARSLNAGASAGDPLATVRPGLPRRLTPLQEALLGLPLPPADAHDKCGVRPAC